MPDYAAVLDRTLSTTATWGSFGASSGTQARRLRLLYAEGGSEATPGDNAIRLTAQRYSNDGTGTAVVPKPLDMADPVMLGVAADNHTVEPTYTAAEIMLDLPFNQKKGFVYYAPEGAEIVVPATDNAGIGFQTDTINTGTPVGTMTIHQRE